MISKFRIGVLVIILNFFASVATTWGQVENPSLLQMAVPSLNIAPDARGGGMGDMGLRQLCRTSIRSIGMRPNMLLWEVRRESVCLILRGCVNWSTMWLW